MTEEELQKKNRIESYCCKTIRNIWSFFWQKCINT